MGSRLADLARLAARSVRVQYRPPRGTGPHRPRRVRGGLPPPGHGRRTPSSRRQRGCPDASGDALRTPSPGSPRGPQATTRNAADPDPPDPLAAHVDGISFRATQLAGSAHVPDARRRVNPPLHGACSAHPAASVRGIRGGPALRHPDVIRTHASRASPDGVACHPPGTGDARPRRAGSAGARTPAETPCGRRVPDPLAARRRQPGTPRIRTLRMRSPSSPAGRNTHRL